MLDDYNMLDLIQIRHFASTSNILMQQAERQPELLDTIRREGELNEQFGCSRSIIKERTRSVDQGTSRNRCCACSFRQRIWNGSGHQKAVRISSGEDRGCPESALGESSGECWRRKEGCSDSWEADALGSRTKEDRRCAKGQMGESESWKENGLAGQSLNESLLEPRGSLLLKQ
jgi:hypothetical protein